MRARLDWAIEWAGEIFIGVWAVALTVAAVGGLIFGVVYVAAEYL